MLHEAPAVVDTAAVVNASTSGPEPATPATSTSAVKALQDQNEQLRSENESLRQRLEEERSLRRGYDVCDNHKTHESHLVKEQITAIDGAAEMLALHSELARLRQTCAAYAEAIEETRSYFFELRRLHADLDTHLRPDGPPQR